MIQQSKSLNLSYEQKWEDGLNRADVSVADQVFHHDSTRKKQ